MNTKKAVPLTNPRYVAYAASEGLQPRAMLARDKRRYPGGHMCGFTLWISERWQVWRRINRVRHDAPLFEDDHRSFDAFIGAKTA